MLPNRNANGSTGSQANISNRYHQSVAMNEDLMMQEEEMDEGLDRTTFDNINNKHSSVSSDQTDNSEDQTEDAYVDRRRYSQDYDHETQPTQPPSNMSAVMMPTGVNESTEHSKVMDTSHFSSNKFQAYFQPTSMHASSGAVVLSTDKDIKLNTQTSSAKFEKCMSDPKIIVARHVFSDNEDFCKKTLDVTE